MSKKKRNHKQRNLRREVFGVFELYPDTPMNYKQVSSALGVKDAGVRKLIQAVIADAVTKQKLKEVDRGKYLLSSPKSENVRGIIEITKSGRGFVIVEGLDEDIKINKDNTGVAMYGDTVEVSLRSKGKRLSGRVVKVIERAKTSFVGIVQVSRNHGFVILSDSRNNIDFFIPKDNLNGAKGGEKVVVEIDRWDNPDESPVGKITKVLGKPGDNDVEMHSIMLEYGLPYEFPEEVLAEAEAIPQEITKEDIKARRDMRETLTFTIDPHDAKDFDDALSYKKLENGNHEVGIHIADVSHYLKEGTLLEEEAFKRATSVYLVDRTVPMLPEILSNQLCSLRPNEEKLCFSAVFEMNDKAEIINDWIGRTVIYSDRRFTYAEAQEVIESGKGDHAEEILILDRLAKIMRKERMNSGSMDFHTEEVKFELDENGKPIGVYVKKMKDSNKLIEDFMLLANTGVAKFIGAVKKSKPKTFVYRIHDEPDPEKLSDLRTFVSKFGYNIPKSALSKPSEFINNIMKQVEGETEQDIVSQMAIRSMAKAEYSTENIGHFGLGFDHYSHFTSPIRRYPDVMVHRLLQRYLDKGESVNQETYELKCRHSSAQERLASEAERTSIKYKQVEYLMSRVGERFMGIISGVTSWGIYVELTDSKCEGMVSLEKIEWDRFEFDEKEFVVRGRRSGQEYSLGNSVTIEVERADLMKRQLDFKLIES